MRGTKLVFAAAVACGGLTAVGAGLAAPQASVSAGSSLSRAEVAAAAGVLVHLLSAVSAVAPAIAAEIKQPSSGARELRGRSIHVSDGDTITLMHDGYAKTTIRLASIDAPESPHPEKGAGKVGQPFADVARQRLRELLGNNEIRAVCVEQDRYERSICELFVGSMSVNRQMVADGMAWANQAASGRYLRDTSLVAVELSARQAKRGLWSAPAVAPWIWRDSCWKQQICSIPAH